MKIIICGATGLLGSDCSTVLNETHEVEALGSSELDITNPAQVEDTIGALAPDIVLNCAGFTNVDACEDNRDSAWKINVDGPSYLAKSVERNGCKLIHISTDYVFDGDKEVPEPYYEHECPKPVTHYGITKLEGERTIKKSTKRYVILRTAWLYGINGLCFPKTMLKLALQHPETELKVVNDQFGSPTWSYRLAILIERLVGLDVSGIYHATSAGYCTWFEFASYFLNKMEVPFNMAPCTSDQYPTPAKRPKNSILINSRLKEARTDIMADWKTDVDNYVDEFRDRLLAELGAQ